MVERSIVRKKRKNAVRKTCSNIALQKKCFELSKELWALQYALDPLGVAEKFSDYLDIIENLKNKKHNVPHSETRLDIDWVRFIIDQPIVKKYINDGDIEKFIMALAKKKIKGVSV